MLFGPLRCEGVGLSDGETMERLWSYLRRFGRMTKEMRPAHRRDVLAHALACYGMKTKVKLGKDHHYMYLKGGYALGGVIMTTSKRIVGHRPSNLR